MNPQFPRPIETAPETLLVDQMMLGAPGRSSGYFIAAPRPALIEPGAVHSAGPWLKALETLGVPRDDVAYIILTHIHLDHGAATGRLARELPRARVIVHPRGARHLVDPSRLVAGARSVFGDRLEELWGLPEDVPADRIDAPEPNQRISLGGGHVLRFIDAPGHARHQYMILNEGTGALFSADELGIRYNVLSAPGRDYILPSTAPNQFDPDAMSASARAVRSLGPECILFSHFGRGESDLETITRRLEEQVTAYTGTLTPAGPAAEGPNWRAIRDRLEAHVIEDLEAQGLPWDDTAREVLELDLEVCARGLADYQRRRPTTL